MRSDRAQRSLRLVPRIDFDLFIAVLSAVRAKKCASIGMICNLSEARDPELYQREVQDTRGTIGPKDHDFQPIPGIR